MLLISSLLFLCCSITFALDLSSFTNYSTSNVGNKFFTTKIIDKSEEKSFTERDETYYLQEHKWYIGGDRINGDKFRYQMYDNYEFPELRDFSLEITFPSQNEFYITQVMIFAQQSSTIGRAYIIDGGIGYTHMRLIIEARRTKFFNYNLQLFGRTFT